MTEPHWIIFARRFLGRAETPGPESSDWLRELWYKLKAGWLWIKYGDDSALPWCGLFVASVMEESGYTLPKDWFRAKSWLDWGSPVEIPVVGCIVVFERKGGGHVGFVVGRDQNEALMVLGGNQKDSVSIAPFRRDRVIGYRWPDRVVVVTSLPLIESGSRVSENEA